MSDICTAIYRYNMVANHIFAQFQHRFLQLAWLAATVCPQHPVTMHHKLSYPGCLFLPKIKEENRGSHKVSDF